MDIKANNNPWFIVRPPPVGDLTVALIVADADVHSGSCSVGVVEKLVGTGNAGPRKSGRQRSGLGRVVWAFERSAGGTWACYDAKMTSALEGCWADGPGAILHVTSSVDAQEFIIDLSQMQQTAVLTGETRAVLRRSTADGEAAYSVTVPQGARPLGDNMVRRRGCGAGR